MPEEWEGEGDGHWSLGNSQTTATGPTGRRRVSWTPILVPAGRLSRGTATPALLPSTWFNMRESKCTIQNLKTGIHRYPTWVAAPTHTTRCSCTIVSSSVTCRGSRRAPAQQHRAWPTGKVTSPSWRLLLALLWKPLAPPWGLSSPRSWGQEGHEWGQLLPGDRALCHMGTAQPVALGSALLLLTTTWAPAVSPQHRKPYGAESRQGDERCIPPRHLQG